MVSSRTETCAALQNAEVHRMRAIDIAHAASSGA